MATSIFYVIKNPDIFTASVLSLQEKSFITQKWRDIAYKNTGWLIDIFIWEQIEPPVDISFTIIFDKDNVTIDAEQISGQGTRTFSTPDQNSIIIHEKISQNTDKNQSIIMLPFTGENKNILLSEAVAKFYDGQEKNLSIGTLNEITSHSQ